MPKSTKSGRRRKSHQDAKPYPEFPLTLHVTGRWCKKHQGKRYYFGPTEGWQDALAKYKRDWPFIIAGKTPLPDETSEGLTIALLCDEFLNAKRHKLDTGELSQRSFSDYFKTCTKMVKNFGGSRRVDDLRPDEFAGFRSSLADGVGVVTLKGEINRVRVAFKFAHDQRLIEQPVNYGQSFDRPSAKSLRRARNASGPKMFEADELRRILDAADLELRAMVLLAINCGFGNTDIASLPQLAINFGTGLCTYPRPKTEIHRRIPLWSETIEVLRKAIDRRPKPIDDANIDLCFLTRFGAPWVRVNVVDEKRDDDGRIIEQEKHVPVDALSAKFAKLMKKLGINGHRGFYCIRHSFETIGGESRDQVAVNAIMGHVDSSMAATYRERISDERLRAVTETVRVWLWPADDTATKS